jgi:hypothetical protein
MTGNTTHFKFFSVPLKWLGMGDFKVYILLGLKELNFKEKSMRYNFFLRAWIKNLKLQ